MNILSIKRDTFDDLMEVNHREARQKRLKRQNVIRRIVYLAKKCGSVLASDALCYLTYNLNKLVKITGQYKKSLSGLTFYFERNLINVKSHI